MNRIERFYQLSEFENLRGLPEKLVEMEKEMEENLGDNFRFSKREYDSEIGKKIILGKINDWYFLGGEDKEYKVFEDKKTIQLYLKRTFDKANRNKKEEEQIDPSWKAFWNRQIETL